MKKHLILFALLLCFVGCAFDIKAQSIKPPNEKTIVRDGSGAAVPYATWFKMLRGGWYTLKPIKGTTEYYLSELSKDQKAKLDEKRNASLANRPKPAVSAAFNEGDNFKGTKITDVLGNKYDLRKPNGKIYILNFWFIKCEPCKKEIPDLNKLVEKYKDNKDVIFLAIGLDGAYDIKQFLSTTPFRYNIVDDGRYLASKYNVKLYPTHAVVGKDGTIRFSGQGTSSNMTYLMEKTIEEQLSIN